MVGRDEELAAIDRFLSKPEDLPSALVLTGEAGIGKTRLWQAGMEAARTRAYNVLATRSSPAEAQLSFVGLTDLLESVAPDVFALLPPPQRRGLEAILLRTEPEIPAPDRLAIGVAFLNVVRHLAVAAPVALAVDDLQWLDVSTAEVLLFALRRIADEPVAFLATFRSDSDEQVSFGFEAAYQSERLERLRLGPLSLGALSQILRAHLRAPLSRPTLRRIHEASDGNPFFALELGQAVLRRGLPAPGEPLAVPTTLEELMLERLLTLPGQVGEILLHVAALSSPTSELLEAAGVKLDGLEKALAARVLELADGRLRFTHPLLASTVYGRATPEQRRAAHRRLAVAAADVEERGRHLALAATGPSADVADVLDDAGRTARARGASGSAAQLMDLGIRLTPPDMQDARRRRAVVAAECHFEAGQTDVARSLLERVVAEAGPGPERANALARLGWLYCHSESWPRGAECFRAALAEEDSDETTRLDSEKGLTWTSHMAGDLAAAERHAQAALGSAERLGQPEALGPAIAELAFVQTLRGVVVPSSTVNRAVELEQLDDRRLVHGRAHWLAAMIDTYAANHDSARSRLRALEVNTRERGDEHALPFVLNHLSRVELLAGDWALAARYVAHAYASAVETGQRPELGFVLATKALVDAHLGREEEARAALEEGFATVASGATAPARYELWAATGFLELSLGRAEEAHVVFDRLAGAVSEAGFGDPCVFRFHANAAEAALAIGREEEAATFVEQLEDAGRSDRPWNLASGGRSRGLLQASHGELAEATTTLERTLLLHERLPEPFERARTLLALGRVQRRSKQRGHAQRTLEAAAAVFQDLGAPLWAEQARTELARTGGRTAKTDELTPAERRVADLVVQGLSNKEVASTLFVSVHTVEVHLSRVYAKLGIRSRGQLAGRLG